MVFESAELSITPGHESAFEAVVPDGLRHLRDAPGCRSVSCARGVEGPQTYLLLIAWDSVADHLAFTRTPGFDAFKAVIGPHLAGPSRMAHFEPFA